MLLNTLLSNTVYHCIFYTTLTLVVFQYDIKHNTSKYLKRQFYILVCKRKWHMHILLIDLLTIVVPRHKPYYIIEHPIAKCHVMWLH